jgi:hypothetical protein
LVLATATNWFKNGQWHGAEMTYYPHRGGGWVFSVGSITFGGSLVVDSRLQQILRNALEDAMAEAPSLTLRRGPAGTTLAQVRGRFGASYQLQHTANWPSSPWTPLADLTLNTNLTATLTLELNEPQTFLRLLQLP